MYGLQGQIRDFSLGEVKPINGEVWPPQSYYKGRSVPDSVCPLTPLPFTDRQMPGPLQSVCAGESQAEKPIGSALVCNILV